MTEPEGVYLLEPEVQHGLIGTMLRAYNEHRSLILRPDDIWFAITSALSVYVEHNAERLRSHFVNFEKKRKLEVHGGSSMAGADWNAILGMMSTLIDQNTNRHVLHTSCITGYAIHCPAAMQVSIYLVDI